MIGDVLRTRLVALRPYREPALFCVLAVVQALLVLCAARPPFRDGPVYEVTFFLLSQEAGVRTWFTTDLLGSHGSAVFALGAQLARVVGAQAAFQLLMAAAVFGTPLAFRVLCGVLGRGALLSWIVLPLAFHAGVFLGDLRLALALPLALLQIACVASLLRSRSLWIESALTLLSIALFFSHSGLWMAAFAMAWLGLLFASEVPILVRARAPFVAGLAVIASILVLDLSWLETFDDDFRLLLADCEPSARLRDFSLFSTFTLREDSADRLTKAWAVLIAFSVGLALTHSSQIAAEARKFRMYAASSAGLALLGFVLTPIDFDVTWGWGVGWGGLCVLLLLPALPLPSGRVRQALLGSFALIALWRAGQVWSAFAAFYDGEVSDFETVINKVPTRRHLLVLIADPYSTYVHPPAFANYSAFYQIVSPDGLAAPIVGDLPAWPVALRDNAPRPPLPEQRTLFATGYVYPATLDWADYVMTRGVWTSRPEDRTKLYHDGHGWKLYRVMPPEESIRAPRGTSAPKPKIEPPKPPPVKEDSARARESEAMQPPEVDDEATADDAPKVQPVR
jgi:hypothetical protein